MSVPEVSIYHPLLKDEETECSICFVEFDDNELNTKVLDCTHRFHKACVDAWIKKKHECPTCRVGQNPLQLKVIQGKFTAQDILTTAHSISKTILKYRDTHDDEQKTLQLSKLHYKVQMIQDQLDLQEVYIRVIQQVQAASNEWVENFQAEMLENSQTVTLEEFEALCISPMPQQIAAVHVDRRCSLLACIKSLFACCLCVRS